MKYLRFICFTIWAIFLYILMHTLYRKDNIIVSSRISKELKSVIYQNGYISGGMAALKSESFSEFMKKKSADSIRFEKEFNK